MSLRELRNLFRYDLPRQTLLSFLIAIGVTAGIGWLISSLDQVTEESIAKSEVRGTREGRLDGYEAGFERGRLDGAGRSALVVDELLVEGDPADGYGLAYDFAWNDAVDIALLTAKGQKLEVDAAFEQWEALRR